MIICRILCVVSVLKMLLCTPWSKLRSHNSKRNTIKTKRIKRWARNRQRKARSKERKQQRQASLSIPPVSVIFFNIDAWSGNLSQKRFSYSQLKVACREGIYWNTFSSSAAGPECWLEKLFLKVKDCCISPCFIQEPQEPPKIRWKLHLPGFR